MMFMLVSMPCLVGYDSLLIWWIVMWYPHDYVDIMFMHCNLHHVILSWLSIFAFKFNRNKLNLNNCWLSHGATISKLTNATTLTLWGGPNWVYCHASRRCLPRGKVMRGRCLGQVGRHKPCVPLVVVAGLSRLGPFLFFHDGGRWCLW